MNIRLPGYSTSYEDIYEVVSRYGNSVAIIGGEQALLYAMPYIKEFLGDLNVSEPIIYGNSAKMENVEALKKNKDVEGSDVLFAIGGGKAIDTVKMLGYELNKPVFTFPTISSTPAAVSDVAYIDKIPYFINDIVKHTFINDDIIINAPYMYFHLGVGYIFSKSYEILFKSRGMELTYEDRLATTILSQINRDVFTSGKIALDSFKKNGHTHKLILDSIVLMGYVSILLNKEYYNGLASSICEAINQIDDYGILNLENEALPFGILVNLIIEKSNDMYRAYDFLKDNRYPTRLIDLKMKTSLINKISEQAMNNKHMTDYPKVISKHDIFRAMILLEEDFLLNTKWQKHTICVFFLYFPIIIVYNILNNLYDVSWWFLWLKKLI